MWNIFIPLKYITILQLPINQIIELHYCIRNKLVYHFMCVSQCMWNDCFSVQQFMHVHNKALKCSYIKLSYRISEVIIILSCRYKHIISSTIVGWLLPYWLPPHGNHWPPRVITYYMTQLLMVIADRHDHNHVISMTSL